MRISMLFNKISWYKYRLKILKGLGVKIKQIEIFK